VYSLYPGTCTYQALNARMNGNPSARVLQEIADVLGCSVLELIATDKNLAHFYDENGEWQGVRNK
jgi:transcriptional regulator with XRE-family HTH domain